MRFLLALAVLVSCSRERDPAEPLPSMVIEPVLTISGTTVIERGECIGFRVQTDLFPMTDPRLYFNDYEVSGAFWYLLDEDTIQVGFPCFYTPLSLPLGTARVTVIDGGESISADAFTVIDTIRVDIGDAPASSISAAEPDANELGHSHDFDVYSWNAPDAGLYAIEVLVVDTANAAFKPYQFTARRDSGGSWNGHEVILAPLPAAEMRSLVADDTTGGGDAYRYVISAEPLPEPIPAGAPDLCDETAATPGLYAIELEGAANDYDPDGAETCADRHVPHPPFPGEGVRAPGPDRALRVHVPAGAGLQVAAQSAGDVVLYLLSDCGAPQACLSAADTFGSHATETLVWKNDGSDLDAWLVVDVVGTPAGVTLRMRDSE